MTEALTSTFALPHSGQANVLLVTDGEIEAIGSVLEAAKASNQRVFVVGIGTSPAEAHLRRLAQATNGACEFVAPGEVVEPAVLRMFHRLSSLPVTELKVQWPVGCEAITSTNLPAAVFDGDTVTFSARLRCSVATDVEERTKLLGRVGGQGELVEIASLEAKLINDPENTLARMAANSRYQEVKRCEETQSFIKGQLPTLAEKYQLVTEDTSFILVHARAAQDKPADMPEMRQVASMLAAGWGGHGSVQSPSAASSILPSSRRADAQGADRTPASMHVPSVWRTNRSPAAARIDARSMGGMDSFEIPAFLRRQADTEDDIPFGGPVAKSRRNPDFWSSRGKATVKAQDAALADDWDEGYTGLTPAGFVNYLRINEKSGWPTSYKGLQTSGLGLPVIEWLEFVIGEGQDEKAVVAAFIAVMLEFNFTLRQGYSKAVQAIMSVVTGREATSGGVTDSALLAEIKSVLEGATGRRWPRAVVDFAEAKYAS